VLLKLHVKDAMKLQNLISGIKIKEFLLFPPYAVLTRPTKITKLLSKRLNPDN